MIKNYIFDFDGTLADTGTGIIKTMQESFRLHGLTVPSDEEVKSVIDLPLAGSVKALGISDSNSIDEICATYRRLFPDVTVAVTYGNHSREKLLTANPNFLIDNMGELLSLSS